MFFFNFHLKSFVWSCRQTEEDCALVSQVIYIIIKIQKMHFQDSWTVLSMSLDQVLLPPSKIQTKSHIFHMVHRVTKLSFQYIFVPCNAFNACYIICSAMVSASLLGQNSIRLPWNQIQNQLYIAHPWTNNGYNM